MENIIDCNNLNLVTSTKVPFKHDDFESLYNQGYEINNFVGGVEVNISVISDDVPEEFPDSSITEEGEDAVEFTRQKKFDEYCSYVVSLDSTKALLKIGACDFNGNRKDQVKHKELVPWIEYFGISNILTKSAYVDLLSSASYKDLEDIQ